MICLACSSSRRCCCSVSVLAVVVISDMTARVSSSLFWSLLVVMFLSFPATWRGGVKMISAYVKAFVAAVVFEKYSSSATFDRSIDIKLALLSDIHEFSPLENPLL